MNHHLFRLDANNFFFILIIRFDDSTTSIINIYIIIIIIITCITYYLLLHIIWITNVKRNDRKQWRESIYVRQCLVKTEEKPNRWRIRNPNLANMTEKCSIIINDSRSFSLLFLLSSFLSIALPKTDCVWSSSFYFDFFCIAFCIDLPRADYNISHQTFLSPPRPKNPQKMAARFALH